MGNKKSGYGNKDGKQTGKKRGGQGRNRTDTCRHPTTKNKK